MPERLKPSTAFPPEVLELAEQGILPNFFSGPLYQPYDIEDALARLQEARENAKGEFRDQ